MVTQSPVNSESTVCARVCRRRRQRAGPGQASTPLPSTPRPESELYEHLLRILVLDTAVAGQWVGFWLSSDPDLNSVTAVTVAHRYAKPSGTRSRAENNNKGPGGQRGHKRCHWHLKYECILNTYGRLYLYAKPCGICLVMCY